MGSMRWLQTESSRTRAAGESVVAAEGEPHSGGSLELDHGPLYVSAETSRRVACDASVVVMQHDGAGRVLDVGRTTRTTPPHIRRALAARDATCQFPGCTACSTNRWPRARGRSQPEHSPLRLAAVVRRLPRMLTVYTGHAQGAGLAMENLVTTKREQILRLARQHGVTGVRVFGSMARGDAGPDSDVDLLVEVGPEPSAWFPGGLVADLEALLGRRVQVVTERGLDELLSNRVRAEAVPL